jgi:hypothetical protein
MPAWIIWVYNAGFSGVKGDISKDILTLLFLFCGMDCIRIWSYHTANEETTSVQ